MNEHTLWSVHIHGMDDVLPAVDRADAYARAHQVNIDMLALERDSERSVGVDYRPVVWAVPQSGSPYGGFTAEQVDATWKAWRED